jgi:hypothetical protein
MILIVLALTTSACGFYFNMPKTVKGNGVVMEETRSVDSFDQIEINGIGEFTVVLGTKESLRVEAEENLLPYLETYVRGSTLVVEIEDGRNILPTEPVNFYLTVVALEALDISGLGNIQLPEIETEDFRISLSGAGNIDIESLDADTFNVTMSGLGDLTVSDGQVASQDVTISGGGKYFASSLESADAVVTISGVGSATLRASEFLKVTISGGGDVNYYGNPEVDTDISGLGNLDRLGD